MFTIDETSPAQVAIPPHAYVRAVSLGSGTVSYWQKTPPNLLTPNHHNDVHFTLGAIVGNVGHFHATDHGGGTVSNYTCTVNAQTGALTVAWDHGDQAYNATANPFGVAIYRAVEIREGARKAAIDRVKLSGPQRRGGLFGAALQGIKKPTTQRDAKAKRKLDTETV